MNKKIKLILAITQSEMGGAQEYVFNLATSLPKDQFEVIITAGPEGGQELLKLAEKQGISTKLLRFSRRSINPFWDFLMLIELYRFFKQEQPDIIHLNSSKMGFAGSISAHTYKLTKKLLNCFKTSYFGIKTNEQPLANLPRCSFSESESTNKQQIVHHVSQITNNKSQITNNQQPITIYTAHGWVFKEPLPKLLQKLYFWLEKYSARLKDTIICVAETDKTIALQNHFPIKKIVTIHNAVNPEKLDFLETQTARTELFKIIGLDEAENKTKKIIATAANFYPTKGLVYLIQASKKILEKNPDCLFIVMGEGAERQKMEKEIKNLGLEKNFFLPGTIPQAHRYFKALDVFVLPSVKEGLPYVLLKAIAAQIPVVATKVGGIPEILDSQFMVEPTSVKELTNAILNALENKNIPAKTGNDFQAFLQKTITVYLN